MIGQDQAKKEWRTSRMRTSAGSVVVWLHAGYRRALVYCQGYRQCLDSCFNIGRLCDRDQRWLIIAMPQGFVVPLTSLKDARMHPRRTHSHLPRVLHTDVQPVDRLPHAGAKCGSVLRKRTTNPARPQPQPRPRPRPRLSANRPPLACRIGSLPLTLPARSHP